jgi:hypothetical protein
VPASAGRIGAGFGIEGRLPLLGMAAQALDHLRDYMIKADAYLAREELHRQMAIAEMPGDAHQRILVMSVDVEHPLRHGPHSHQAPIFEPQRIARPQGNGLRQVEHDLGAGNGFEQEATPMPMVMIEQHGIRGIGIEPITGGNVFSGADHASVTIRDPPAPSIHSMSATQNKKYRCAIGNTVAGSQVRITPSARTS